MINRNTLSKTVDKKNQELNSNERVNLSSTKPIILYKGVKHANVKELKRNLNRLGFGDLKVDYYFGDFTEKKLKVFQGYYGLEVNGIADVVTLSKIEELIDSPFQLGRYNEELIPLKQKLNWIGYGNIKVTNYFGPTMDKHVKEFQKDYHLPVNGIIDDLTFVKIEEVLSDIFKLGNKHEQIAELKNKLNRLGFNGIKVTNSYGEFLEKRVKEFQSYYGLTITGNVNYETLNKIDEILFSQLQVGKRHIDVFSLKEKLFILGYGDLKNTNKFGKATEEAVKRFQKDYDLPVSGIADKKTLFKIENAINYNERVSYTQYPLTLEKAIEIQMKANPLINDNAKSKEADESELAVFLNPITFINNDKQKFQFLNLSKANVVKPAVLHKFLKRKEALGDTEEAFVEAGINHSINELYLVSIALLETNNGSNVLAKGAPVNDKGEITFVDSLIGGEKRIEPGVTSETVKFVYNIFGINDKNVHNIDLSVKKAFEENWDTPQKAIIGGARFIKEKYAINEKNTFYNMRWQPAHMAEDTNAGEVVSNDIDWASRQVETLYDVYQQMESYQLFLDIPVYKDQPSVKYKRG